MMPVQANSTVRTARGTALFIRRKLCHSRYILMDITRIDVLARSFIRLVVEARWPGEIHDIDRRHPVGTAYRTEAARHRSVGDRVEATRADSRSASQPALL